MFNIRLFCLVKRLWQRAKRAEAEIRRLRADLNLVTRERAQFYDANMTLVRRWVQQNGTIARQVTTIVKLEKVAGTDPLTGLYNRRGAHDAFNHRLWLQRRHDLATQHQSMVHNLTVIVIDLDGFKAINDKYGHAAGDTVLVVVAEQLRLTFRNEDFVVRPGGDEFFIYIIDDATDETVRRAERVLELLTTDHRLHFDNNMRVSASLGVAHGQFHIANGGAVAAALKDLEQLADEAMYIAKRNGGDTVVSSPTVTVSDTAHGDL